MAADRRGNAPEGATIKTGGITINTRGRVTIDGVRKINVSSDGLAAIGIAGTVGEHPYFELAESMTSSDLLDAARSATHAWSELSVFRERLGLTSHMSQEVLISLFDEPTGHFMTFLADMGFAGLGLGWNLARTGTILLHMGSGSKHFEQAVGLDAINRWVGAMTDDTDPSMLRDWIGEAFRKVSELDSACSAEFQAVIATRDDPAFRRWE